VYDEAVLAVPYRLNGSFRAQGKGQQCRTRLMLFSPATNSSNAGLAVRSRRPLVRDPAREKGWMYPSLWMRAVDRACASARAWMYAAVPVLVLVVALPIITLGQSPPPWPPPTLRDTGLYADWATKTVATGNHRFSPQYPLWSDGAAKSRWLHIPKGRFIDGSDPDEWKFPVGTKLWKEFAFGARAETRFIERTRSGWQFATYVWNDDESDAVLAPEGGIKQSVTIQDGIRHAIPSRVDCRVCHEAGPVRVLGVTALQLSPDRDPNAPHAEPLPEGAVDLRTLAARGLVRGLPARVTATPPRILASTPTARAALGYLHANCGGCHTGAGELRSLTFALNYTLNRAEGETPPALLTSVGQPSRFKVPTVADAVERVCAGQPEKSVLVARMASRHPLVQMPPLGTRLVDEEAVSLIRRWIADDLGAPQRKAQLTEEGR
jgi:mono/diheme cytochrome c family protein